MNFSSISQILVDETAYWTHDRINAFYNGVAFNPINGFLTIRTIDSGYIATSPTDVTLYDTVSGIEYRISKYWAEHDWVCFQGLYTFSLNNDRGFKICQPLESKKILVNGEEWMFTSIQHPDGKFGKPWASNWTSFGPNVIVDYAQGVFNFLASVKQISTIYGNSLAPNKVGNFGELWQNETGQYWRRLENWSTPFNDAVMNLLEDTNFNFDYIASKSKPELLNLVTHFNDKNTYLENLWLPLTQ